MPLNGSGVFTPDAADFPAVPGTIIESAKYNNVVNDVASGISTAIMKDGQSTPTANIPLGNNKIINLAAGTASTDAANLSNIQSGTGAFVSVVGGTANAITLAPSPSIAAYATGQRFYFFAATANTAAATVAVSGLTAKDLVVNGNVVMSGGEIQPGIVCIVYDGTRFQCSNIASFLSPGTGAVAISQNGVNRERLSVLRFMTVAQRTDVTSRTGAVDVTAAVQAALDYCAGVKELYCPAGVYRMTAEVAKAASNITIIGDGPDLTLFATTSTTANVFNFGDGASIYTNVFLSGMGFTGTGGARSAGSYVKFNKITRCGIDNFQSNIGFKTVEFLDCVLGEATNAYITNPTATTGVGIRIRGGNDITLTDVLIAGNSAAECKAGVFIETTAATWMDNVGALDTGIGLLLQPQSAADVIEHVFSTRCAWDNCSSHGVLMDAAAATFIRRCKFVQDWAGTNDESGFTTNGAGTISDIEFVAPRSYNNAIRGFQIGSGTDIRILGGTVSGNSRGSSGTYDGIYIDNINGFSIIGVTSSQTGSFTNTQRYGIAIINAASTNFIVKDNILTTNVTGGLSTAASTSVVKIIRDNIGYVGYKEAVTTDTTDGSGDITVTHGMATTPTYIRIQMTGAASVAVWQAHTIGATTFKIRFWSVVAGPGAPLTGTSVTVNWEASI
jgi:hypothetical protein